MADIVIQRTYSYENDCLSGRIVYDCAEQKQLKINRKYKQKVLATITE